MTILANQRLLTTESPIIVNRPDSKFQTLLFLPEGEGRKGEGGLRTKGYFKHSYRLVDNLWYICDTEGNPVKPAPENIQESIKAYVSRLQDSSQEPINYLPLISVITVVLNGERYLEETIQSVINQAYPNVEYIIIDGGSTDGTLDIIKKYEDEIDYWVSERDNGIYDAMNKGIKLALGDTIGILNSDDFYADKNVISNIVKIFLEKNTDSIYGDLCYVDKNDVSKIVRYWKSSKYVPGSFRQGWHPPHPTFFVKQKVYKKCGLFDVSIRISADFELMLRFLEKYKISTYYIPKILVKMRTGGLSNKNLKNIIVANFNVLKSFKKNDIEVNYLLYPIYKIFPKILQFVNKPRD